MTTPDFENLLLLIAVLNGLILLVQGSLGVYTAYQTLQARKDIKIVEHNTNSLMEDRLEDVGEKQFKAGEKKARIAGEKKAATLERGKQLGARSARK